MLSKFIEKIVFLVLIFSLVGCSSGKKEVSGGDEKVTLTVWSWDVTHAYFTDIVEEYKKSNPNIDFNLVEMGTDQIYDKLTVSLKTGVGLPDITTIEGEQMAKFLARFDDAFVDLSNNINKNDFMPIKIAESSKDGKIYAYPWDSAPVGLFYRIDYFEQANIKPESIKTWNDFIEAGKIIEEKVGVKMMPLASSGKDTFFRMLMAQTGSFYFDEEGNSSINSEGAKNSLNIVKEIYDAQITKDYGSWDEYIISMKEGQVATVPEAVWIIGSLKLEASDSKGKWGVMPLPLVKEGATGVASNGGAVVAIPSSTENEQAAKDFLNYAMINIDTQLKSHTEYGLFPSYLPVFDSEKFIDGDEYFNNQPVNKFFGELGENILEVNYTHNFGEATEMSRNAMARVLLSDADVDQVLDELQQEYVNKFGR